MAPVLAEERPEALCFAVGESLAAALRAQRFGGTPRLFLSGS